MVVALEKWPALGIPDNPGAWLMAAAKNRALDARRREKLISAKHQAAGDDLQPPPPPDIETALDEDVGDDLLRLVLISCHPVLSPEARVPFEVPRGVALAERLASVLEVIYLIFNEGYSATAGDDWMRPELCEDALRLGRILAALVPLTPEVHGLVAGISCSSGAGSRRWPGWKRSRARKVRTHCRRRSRLAMPGRARPRGPTGSGSPRSTRPSRESFLRRWWSSIARSRSRWRKVLRQGCADRRAGEAGRARGLSLAAERARRSAGEARPAGGSSRRVPARGLVDSQCPRAGAALGSRRRPPLKSVNVVHFAAEDVNAVH